MLSQHLKDLSAIVYGPKTNVNAATNCNHNRHCCRCDSWWPWWWWPSRSSNCDRKDTDNGDTKGLLMVIILVALLYGAGLSVVSKAIALASIVGHVFKVYSYERDMRHGIKKAIDNWKNREMMWWLIDAAAWTAWPVFLFLDLVLFWFQVLDTSSVLLWTGILVPPAVSTISAAIYHIGGYKEQNRILLESIIDSVEREDM